MTHGHVGIARSSSVVASSDGRDISRFGESGSTTWMLPKRRIFIGDTAWTVAIGGTAWTVAIARSSSHLGDTWNSLDRSISIGRQRLNRTYD